MDIPEYSKLTPNHSREIYIKIHYNDFYKYLNEKYADNLSFGEKLYWYFNSISEYPVCKKCGKRTRFINALKGYCDYCSKKCSNSAVEKIENTKKNNLMKFGGVAPACSKDVIEKIQQTNLERHGSKGYNNRIRAKKTMIEKYGGIGNASQKIREKQQNTLLERYGAKNSMFLEDTKEKIRRTNTEKYGVEWVFQRDDVKQKSIQTCLERYGVDHYNNSEQAMRTVIKNNLIRYGVAYSFQREDVRKKSIQTCMKRYGNSLFNNPEQNKITCLERYGVETHMQIPEVLDKIYQTKKKNHTFNSSLIEKEFELYLKENQIEYKKQYKSSVYPFACDFYFPDSDLYLEINAHWTHGGHPFDSNNVDDISVLECWKKKGTEFYNNAIQTWTVRDVQKRNLAKQNKLNFLEVFTNTIDILIKTFEEKTKH